MTVAIPRPRGIRLDAARLSAGRTGTLALLLAYTALATLLMWPGLVLGPSLDASAFAVAGRELLNGARLYADVWDHKPPGIHIVHGAAQLLAPTGDPWLPMWILSVASVVTAGVLLARLSRDQGRQHGWLVGLLAVVGIAMYPISLGGGMTETLALPPIVGALSLASRATARPRLLLVAGVLLGLASLVSFQAFIALPALMIVAGTRQPTSTIGRVAIVAGGFAAPLVSMAVSLALAGLAREAVDSLVSYNRTYIELSRTHPGHTSANIAWAVSVLACLWTPAAIGLARSILTRRMSKLDAALLVWLVVGIAAVQSLGRLELHYLALLVPPLAWWAGAALPADLGARGPRGAVGPLALGALTVGTVLSGLALGRWYELLKDEAEPWRTADDAVAAWVRAHTPPDARILVWGSWPRVYLRSDRRPATRYIYFFPLTTTGYSTSAMAEGLRSELEATRPAAIIDVGRGSIPLLVAHPVYAGDGRAYDVLDVVRAWVRENYRHAATIDGYRVYVPVGSVAGDLSPTDAEPRLRASWKCCGGRVPNGCGAGSLGAPEQWREGSEDREAVEPENG